MPTPHSPENTPAPQATPAEIALHQSARRIAHDFNNTLGTIIGNLELLRMDLEVTHPAIDSVVEIKKATERARGLVHELLALTGSAPSIGTLPQPAREAHDCHRLDTPSEILAPGGEQQAQPGLHVLYLDDEEPLVFLATNLFKRLGYRVSGFTDTQTACDAFFGNPGQFDLVVTDHNLGAQSGIEVATLMLAVRPELPIILATGELTAELVEHARDAGIRHTIYKPNTVDGLCQAIHQLAMRGSA